jgi:hypothetical protein
VHRIAIAAVLLLSACGAHHDAPPPAPVANEDPPPPACPAGVPDACALIGRQSCDVPLDDFTSVTCGDDGLIAAVHVRREGAGPLPSNVETLYATEHVQIGTASGLLIVHSVGCLPCEAIWGTWDVVDPARASDAALLALQRSFANHGLGLSPTDGGADPGLALGDKPLHSLDEWRAAVRESTGR